MDRQCFVSVLVRGTILGRIMNEELNVGVVGAGYVGLVTGACLAHVGHWVTVMDADADRVLDLEQGRIPIYEPGLEDLMAKAARRLRFTTELTQMVHAADVIFIAVGTPQGEDGSADLSNVAAVARGIGQALATTERQRPLVLINKSTVPVGSGDYVSMLVRDGIEEAIGEGAGGEGAAGFLVVSNPEFLR